MGNKSSRNAEEGSPQQAQSRSHPQSEPTLPGEKHIQTSGISHSNSKNVRSTSNNNNNNSNNNKNGMKEFVKLPHNYEAVIKDSDSPVDKSSPENLLQQLQAGVFLNGRKMKYGVKGDNINCFMVFAKGLKITWGEDMRYWVFQNIETREDGEITVAVLRNVCWLEVHGSFHTKNLTPGVRYEVAYWIKLEDASYGWQLPVNLRLTLPNGSKQERKENLNRNPREEWIRIPVGEFGASAENPGEIEFSLYEFEGGHWKKGLVIKGVTIEPKLH